MGPLMVVRPVEILLTLAYVYVFTVTMAIMYLGVSRVTFRRGYRVVALGFVLSYGILCLGMIGHSFACALGK